jgi:hypothetical protein
MTKTYEWTFNGQRFTDVWTGRGRRCFIDSKPIARKKWALALAAAKEAQRRDPLPTLRRELNRFFSPRG